MATVTTNNDGKILGGYLKEKLSIAMTRISNDEISRAVIKVTSHKLKIPNEKHMQRLLQASFGSYTTAEQSSADINRGIVESLEAHLHAHNWIVVLKAQLAFHRLMQDGSDEICAMIYGRRNLFNLAHTKDLADSPEGAVQTIFIQQYMRYLEERAIAHSATPIKARIEHQAFTQSLLGLPPRAALQATGAFLLLFEVAADVQFFEEALNNYATLLGHQNVLGDAKLLFVALSRGFVRILELAPSMSSEERDQWLPMLKRYSLITTKFIRKLDSMRSSRVAWGEPLPQLQPLPADVMSELVSVLEGRASPTASGSQDDDIPVMKLSDLLKQKQMQSQPTSSPAAIAPTSREQEEEELQRAIAESMDAEAQRQQVILASIQQEQEAPKVLSPAVAVVATPVPVAEPPKPEPPKPQPNFLNDLFAPAAPAAAPTAAAAPAPTAATSAGVDLFATVPAASPASMTSASSAGSMDLFANLNSASPKPPQPGLFDAPSAPASTAAPAAAPRPVGDPFSTFAAAVPAPGTTAPPSSAAPATSGGNLFGPSATGTSDSLAAAAAAMGMGDIFADNHNAAPPPRPGTVDFFAPPTSQPAAAPAAPKPEFDPFATDNNGRQLAW